MDPAAARGSGITSVAGLLYDIMDPAAARWSGIISVTGLLYDIMDPAATREPACSRPPAT